MPTAVIVIACHYHSLYFLSQAVVVRPVTTTRNSCHNHSLYALSQTVVVRPVATSRTPCHNQSLCALSQPVVLPPVTTSRCTPCHNQSLCALYALSQPVCWYVAGKLLRRQIRIFQCTAVLMNTISCRAFSYGRLSPDLTSVILFIAAEQTNVTQSVQTLTSPAVRKCHVSTYRAHMQNKCGNNVVRSVMLRNSCIISRSENNVLSCASVPVAQYHRKSSFFDFYTAR